MRPVASVSGTALVGGIDVSTDPEGVKQRIGYMSQRFSLYELLTVDQNIRFWGGIYGLTGHRIDSRRQFVIEMASWGAKPTLARDLSGGWRQRLARWVRDSPRAADPLPRRTDRRVDPLARRQFWRLIDDLSQSGVTVPVTTHYLDEAELPSRGADPCGARHRHHREVSRPSPADQSRKSAPPIRCTR